MQSASYICTSLIRGLTWCRTRVITILTNRTFITRTDGRRGAHLSMPGSEPSPSLRLIGIYTSGVRASRGINARSLWCLESIIPMNNSGIMQPSFPAFSFHMFPVFRYARIPSWRWCRRGCPPARGEEEVEQVREGRSRILVRGPDRSDIPYNVPYPTFTVVNSRKILKDRDYVPAAEIWCAYWRRRCMP